MRSYFEENSGADTTTTQLLISSAVVDPKGSGTHDGAYYVTINNMSRIK